MPIRTQWSTVSITNPSGSFSIESFVEASSADGLVIVGATHTPIARIHGAYAQAGIGPAELAQAVGEALLASSKVEKRDISELVVASSVPGVAGAFLPTTVRHLLGLTVPNPRHIGTLCTGGASAIADVHRALHFRENGVGMALGTDGQNLGQNRLGDDLREILDEGAARVADVFGVSDAEAVRIALESHRRYHAALDRGVFEEIVSYVPESYFYADENPLRNVQPDQLMRGKTAEGVHIGTSSQMGSGAAGVLLTQLSTASDRGWPILAGIVGYSFSQVDPQFMGLGPISATIGALGAFGLTMGDMSHIEVNETFAGVLAAFLHQREFRFGYRGDGNVPARVNPWGGAIAKGHVMGAKFLEMVNLAMRSFELDPDSQYALATLCGGGGQGAAMVLQNPHFIDDPTFWAKSQQQSIRPRVVRGGLDSAQVEGSALLQCMGKYGYLMVDSTAAAVDRFLREAGSSHPWFVPTIPQELDYVSARQRGVSLPPDLFLRRALDVAIMKRRGTEGNSPTIGKAIGVIGARGMGSQLALDYARAGYEVFLTDLDLATAEEGRREILDILYGSTDPERKIYTAEEAAQILARVYTRGSMHDAIAEVQGGRETRFEMIIESATEDLENKKKIFAALRASGLDPYTILATNSSSLTAEQVGADAVFHYCNPVHALPLVDGSFSEGISPEERARLAEIAEITRKAYYTIEKSDAPGALYNPFFVASYFAGNRLPELEETIQSAAQDKLAHLDQLRASGASVDVSSLERMRDKPRTYAVALLDALYVEAIRSEPQDLEEMRARPFDLARVGREMGRGAQGFFSLIDATGGPRLAVDCADNIAAYYGDVYRAPEVLRRQLAEWEDAGTDESKKWTWLEKGMNKSDYAAHVQETVAALQENLGPDLISSVRSGFHGEFLARVSKLVGLMHDPGVVPASDPARIDNAVGLIGWRNTPEAWLRAQKDMGTVKLVVAGYLGYPIPAFLQIDTTDTLPALDGVRLSQALGGRIARVTVDRPRVGNAVDQGVVAGLDRILKQVADDGNVSVVVLDGKGKSFVGGADITWFRDRQVESARLRAEGKERAATKELAKIYDTFARLEIEAMHRFNEGGRLTVAVVQGNTIGGGVEMAAQADVVLFLENMEGESTKCWMPEASLGIGIGYGAQVNLAKRVGVAHAKRILLTGAAATFGSQEALEMGFADRIVRRDQLNKVLAELTTQWESARATTAKTDFILQWRWREECLEPPEALGIRLAASEKLWSDPHAVEVMALGQVPPWLEGEERALAQKEVDAIRTGSPEAIAMLNTMVDIGEHYDLRTGLTHIFDTPNARAAIGAFPKPVNFQWPSGSEVQKQVEGIVALRQAGLDHARGPGGASTLLSFPALGGEGFAEHGKSRQGLIPVANEAAHRVASGAAMGVWMLGEQAVMAYDAYKKGSFTWGDVGVNSVHSGLGLALFSGLDHLYAAGLGALFAPTESWIARQTLLNIGRVAAPEFTAIGMVAMGLAAATIGVAGAYLQGERDGLKLLTTGLEGFVSGGMAFALGSAGASWFARAALHEFALPVAATVAGTFISGLAGMAGGSAASRMMTSAFIPGASDRTGFARYRVA